MRSSKYNIYTELNKGDDRWLLVQGGRGSFDIVNGKTVDALKKGEDDPESLNEISRENIKVLKDRGYVTELSEDEEFQFIRKLSQAINCVNSQGISITMLPTYNCNFRCE
ncbi:MAG: hypothetical protein PUC44_05095 [Eubacteriales bacterium]|nr:hypothetical protein [Eubacteriales bacterium]